MSVLKLAEPREVPSPKYQLDAQVRQITRRIQKCRIVFKQRARGIDVTVAKVSRCSIV
jgi:hypothetical protein